MIALSPNQLTAVVLVLAVVVVINLLLTIQLTRRLHTTTPSSLRLAGIADGPAPGAPVPLGALAPRAAAEVGDALRHGRALIAFVATGCKPCHQQLPALVSLASDWVTAGGTVLVVARPLDGAAAEFEDALGASATIVTDADGLVTDDFGVEAFPLYLECADGIVVAAHPTVAAVPSLTRA